MRQMACGLLASIALLSGNAAAAADLALKARRVQAEPVLGWNGFYIGGNAGYGWGDADTSTTGVSDLGAIALTPGSATLHPNGWFGGFQGGYNFQVAPAFVLGIET